MPIDLRTSLFSRSKTFCHSNQCVQSAIVPSIYQSNQCVQSAIVQLCNTVNTRYLKDLFGEFVFLKNKKRKLGMSLQ